MTICRGQFTEKENFLILLDILLHSENDAYCTWKTYIGVIVIVKIVSFAWNAQFDEI